MLMLKTYLEWGKISIGGIQREYSGWERRREGDLGKGRIRCAERQERDTDCLKNDWQSVASRVSRKFQRPETGRPSAVSLGVLIHEA